MTDSQSEMKKNADYYNNTGELENTALSQRSQSQQHVQYDSIYMKPKNRQDCYVVIKIKNFLRGVGIKTADQKGAQRSSLM